MKLLLAFIITCVVSQPIVAQNDSNCACCDESYKQFDFWVGNWTVTNPDGSYAGKNTIKKIQDNCILKEDWTSATPGYTGTSYNFYNVATGLWEQLWIDNQGQSLHMTGKRRDNNMILSTKAIENDLGQMVVQRITWTKNKDGSVRQLWETIINGDEIIVAFDGLYKQINKRDQ